jgi:hypothetical protein
MTDIIIISALKECVFWTTCGPDLYIYISGFWHNPIINMLIEEQRRGNNHYHDSYGRSQQDF